MSKKKDFICPLFGVHQDCPMSLANQHRESLIAMTEWFKKMIVARSQGTPELTAEYCDELINDLKGFEE